MLKIYFVSVFDISNQFNFNSVNSVRYVTQELIVVINPIRHEEKRITRRHGGEGSIGPPLFSKVFNQLT